MVKDLDKFVLDFKEGKIQVNRRNIGGNIVFQIQFSDKRRPLILTRAKHANAYGFWTSIPEGRQAEAEEVGPLISEYFKEANQ